MAKTVKTTPIKYLALNQVDRIQITKSKLAKNQVYPIEEIFLKEFINNIDPKYLYELKSIELKPKVGRLLGVLGSYYPKERRIVLYSTYPILVFRKKDNTLIESIERFNGIIKYENNLYWASWGDSKQLSLWYVYYVLCHEIAHHYIQMNRFRRARTTKLLVNETRADALAEKIYEETFSMKADKLE